jgi:hypothetical protein
MLSRSLVLVCVASLFGSLACKDKSKKTGEEPNAQKVAEKATPKVDVPVPQELLGTHSGGMERFKEPGVYVDGKPLGVLKFGELPVPLEPVWFEEKAAKAFKPGDTVQHKIVEQRRYRFRDYLAAMGVDVPKIKELHLYGGNQRAAAVVIPGDNLRSFDDFLFRFGGSIWGKPLPACPAKVGDGKCPDQIGTVVLYVEKDPPKRIGGHFYLDGKRINGIPYFGDPIRGGVRVYLDGPLVATIKRNKLKASNLKPTGPEGNQKYKLVDFLKSQGVDTDVVQEAWLVHYERRIKKLTRAEILEAQFKAGASGSGEVLVGADETATHAISLHSKTVELEDLPKLRQEELDRFDG